MKQSAAAEIIFQPAVTLLVVSLPGDVAYALLSTAVTM